MSVVWALVRAARPRQWVKNVLVAAGPLAAGNLAQHGGDVAVAFVLFCVASSAVYLLNDVLDREQDRLHPVKKSRPIASGELPVPLAVAAASILGVAAIGIPVVLGEGALSMVLAAYIAVQIAYCLWLKHQAVLDLAVVSSGFLLRAVAGGVAASVVLSPWFLLVASFGSLFMAAGKRYSEVRLVGEGRAETRRSLELYSASYLRFVWSIACTATIVFYALWAIELGRGNELLPQLSLIPFVLAMLRYAIDVDKGGAGEPESIVLGDRVLQLLGVLWLGTFAASTLVR